MYYYIFDIKKFKKRTQVDEIKNHLSVLGISGEYSYPTPLQSVEELVDQAIAKKYTTIVGIGGEEIANSIANRLLGRKEALGVIPIEQSTNLNQLLGVDNWRDACEALRYRKIKEIRIGQTGSGNAFLTEVYLDIKAPLEVTLEFKDFLVQGKLKNLTISIYHPGVRKIGDDYLDIMMTSVDPNESALIKRLSTLLGNKNPQDERTYSILRARSLRIFTKTPMGILSNDTLLAKTPQLIESSDEYLRLITGKHGA